MSMTEAQRKAQQRERGREAIWGPGHNYHLATTACILEAMGVCVSKGYSDMLNALHAELLRRTTTEELNHA